MMTQVSIAISIAIIFVICLYFVLVRPQMKRLDDHKKMVGSLKIGDQVLTAGGVVGTVTELGEGKYIHLEISKGVEVKMRRSMVYGRA